MNMKKKLLVITPAVMLIGALTFIAPLRAMTIEALSVFRVNEVKTIKIAMTDLEEAMQSVKKLKNSLEGKKLEHKELVNVISKEEAEKTILEAARDFKPFRLRLPKELENQKAEIQSLSPRTITFTVNTPAVNELLTMVKSPTMLSEAVGEEEMVMNIPAMATVHYKDVLFFATQKPALEASETAKQELTSVLTEGPLVPSAVRSQLAEIDLFGNDLYLPILVGFGREVDLGGRLGYVYNLSDLQTLGNQLPEGMKKDAAASKATEEKVAKAEKMKEKLAEKYSQEELAKMEEKYKEKQTEMKNHPKLENASVLIWTKDGILYAVAGDKTDAQLTKIAKSVR